MWEQNSKLVGKKSKTSISSFLLATYLFSGKSLTDNSRILIDPYFRSGRHGSRSTGSGDRSRYFGREYTTFTHGYICINLRSTLYLVTVTKAILFINLFGYKS